VPARDRDLAPAPHGDGDYLAGDELGGAVSAWQQRRRRITVGLVVAFVAGPAVSLAVHQGFTGKAEFLLPGTAVFVAAMVRTLFGRGPVWIDPRRSPGWVVLIIVLGGLLFVVGGMSWLTTLAVTAALFGNLLLRSRWAAAGIAASCALGLGMAAGVWRFGYGNTLVATGMPALAGLLAYSAARRSDLLSRLHEARAELARMAVADERLRIARDLHDLLGHSLSLISLKAELAGRLIAADPARAAKEIAELETVARRSLTEVRQAVTSYRQPTLAAELAAARRMLASAGVAVRMDVPRAYSLPPAVDALLAWTVREGATNIVRHAAARHAKIRVGLAGDNVAAELLDDGAGPPGPRTAAAEPAPGGGAEPAPFTGSGLAGLAERAARLGGRLSAGAGEAGGFRLLVSVPLTGAGLPPEDDAMAPASDEPTAAGPAPGAAVMHPERAAL
jgi:two-component system sensor histidine kinase DesK